MSVQQTKLCSLQGKSALWSHLFAFHVADQRQKANMQQSSAGSGHQTSGEHNISYIHIIYNSTCAYAFSCVLIGVAWWQHDVVVNTLVTISEVTLCHAQLVLGWVTVCQQVNHLSM